MVSEKVLEVNHHVIAEILIIGVVLQVFGEDFTGVDDARYVLHIDIFGLRCYSLTMFSLKLRFLIPFYLTEASHCTHALLLLYIVVQF